MADVKSARATAPPSIPAPDEPRAVSVPPPLPRRAGEGPASGPAPPLPIGARTDQASPAAAPATVSPETDDADQQPSRRQAQRRPAGPSRGRIAANDDAPSIGGLIYALNQKPSNKPFIAAAAATGVWLALSMGFAWFQIGPDVFSGKGIAEIIGRISTMGLIATMLGPVALFWFLAVLAWRTDELKLRSTAMTEVAVRLAEPDRMAEQSVASLGQAVRRQVSFMNDAVGRALGRAGELEALVHNEVTALERSYEDNERKIRSLIQELAGERNALLSTGDRVSETLKSLGSEVPGLIDKLTQQQIKLARIIEGAGQNLTQLETAMGSQSDRLETALSQRTQELQSVLGSQSQQLQSVLGSRAQEIQSVLENYTGALGSALGNRSEQMEQMFSTYMQSIDTTIGGKTETLQNVFEEYARALDTTLANRAQALDSQLVERTKTLDNAFTERLRLFDESILRSTAAIDGAVGERANALTTAMEYHAQNISETISSKALAITGVMENHARSMSDTIGKKAVELDETLMHGINAVRRTSENITKQSLKAIEGLANQSDMLKSVSENMLTQIAGVTNRFENQGQTIMKAANALETANYKIDQTLQVRQSELGQTLDRLGGKAEDLSRLMQGYSTSLEGSLTEAEQRARQITAELSHGAQVHSRTTIAEIERLRQDAAFEADRALDDLRSKFTNVSHEVTQQLGTLTNQFTETSSQMRDRTAAAAIAFEAEQMRMRSQVDQQIGSLTEHFNNTSSHLRTTTAAATSAIQAEQEQLRQQMQSLPATTRETADAMRRALGDQLRALEQLSTLTTREAHRRDVAPPVEPPAARPVALTAAPYPSPPVSREPNRSLSNLGSSLAQEMGHRQQPAAQPQPQFNPPPQQSQVRQPQPPMPQQAPPQQQQPVMLPPPEATDARGNWSLGDLLARASHDDDRSGTMQPSQQPMPMAMPAPMPSPVAPAPAPMAHPQPIQTAGNGLNVDVISRALDPSTATAIWSRFRGGQRGVMVRSIYTAEGRVAFDEISRRFRSDLDFQQTVNRYLSDYERILGESDRRDPSGRATLGQIATDTGRVYLFLAHASGRLS